MRTLILVVALLSGSMLVSGAPVAPGSGKGTSVPPDERMLKGKLGPNTEVAITYSATQAPATVHIGQKKFLGYRNQSVVYFSEFIKGKTDEGYELELSPDFRSDGENFLYSVPGTATSIACGSPDSLILIIFRDGKRENAACIERDRSPHIT